MNVEIAQRLAELRREKGYSQEELAENLGLSRQAVSKWERAESSPDTGNLVALAKLYGVTLDDLLRVDDDIEDDVKFEAQDRTSSKEAEVLSAAEQANAAAAAAQAAAAQAAAAQAQATQQAQAATSQAHAAACQAYAPQPTQPPAPQGAPQPYPPTQPYAQAPGQPSAPAEEKEPKGPWLTFPYPILCTIIFLAAGFLMGAWHPAWVVFLTIPLYYWIAHIIENDPNYRK